MPLSRCRLTDSFESNLGASPGLSEIFARFRQSKAVRSERETDKVVGKGRQVDDACRMPVRLTSLLEQWQQLLDERKVRQVVDLESLLDAVLKSLLVSWFA